MRKIFKKLKKLFVSVFKNKEDEKDNIYNKCLLVLRRAVRSGSSDIHIQPFESHSEIYFRIDGDLVAFRTINIMDHLRMISILKLLSGLDTSNHTTVQEGQLSIVLPEDNSKSEFRVSFIPTEYGEKAVVRVLGRSLISVDRKILGFTDDDNRLLDNLLHKRRGLVLLCGVTGSGKTTTIYSFLNNLKTQAVNITTIEDPIEYVLDGITQTAINSAIGYTYDSAIKAVLRQDPDILYVGEIRDYETASAAVNAVLTGHMVFTSVHSDSIVGAFVRLFKLGVNSQQISEAVGAVICQTLVKRVCTWCAVRRFLTSEEKSLFGIDEDIVVYSENPDGCDSCNSTGSKGRIAAYEMFVPSENERVTLAENPSTIVLKRMINSHGTLNDSICRLLKNGIISVEEALRKIR